MEWILNQTFENETIIFDGFAFIGCTFKNCMIIINSAAFDFDRCSFVGSIFRLAPGLQHTDPLTLSVLRDLPQIK